MSETKRSPESEKQRRRSVGRQPCGLSLIRHESIAGQPPNGLHQAPKQQIRRFRSEESDLRKIDIERVNLRGADIPHKERRVAGTEASPRSAAKRPWI